MWFIMIASMVLQVAAQKKAAQAAAQEAEFQRREALANQKQAAADAKLSAQVAEAEGVEARLEGEALESSRKVAQAASGGRIDVGTNFLISVQDAARTDWEVFKANLGSTQRTNRFAAEANSYLREAGQLSVKKRNIRSAARLQMASTVVGGFGRAYSLSGSGSSPSYTGSAASTGSGAYGGTGGGGPTGGGSRSIIG